MVCRWGMPGLIFSKLLNVSPVWQNEEAVGPVGVTERLHINSTGFWSWQLLYRAASVVVDIFRTVCKDHLQERCLSIKSFYVISSDCAISLLPPVLGKTLPHAPPSQIEKSLGPKGMRDTWKSSSEEPLIEIVGHSMYLLDPEISDFICVLVVTEFQWDFHSLWRQGEEEDWKLLYLSPHFISQDKTISILVVFHAKEMCLDMLLIKCEFINKVKWEKGIAIWSWLHFL